MAMWWEEKWMVMRVTEELLFTQNDFISRPLGTFQWKEKEKSSKTGQDRGSDLGQRRFKKKRKKKKWTVITKRGNLARCPSHVGPVRSKTSPSGVLKTCRLGRKEKRLWRVGGRISSSHFPFLLPTFLSIARSHALAGINQFKHCEVKGRKELYVFIPLYPSSYFFNSFSPRETFHPLANSCLSYLYFLYEFSLSRLPHTQARTRTLIHTYAHTRAPYTEYVWEADSQVHHFFGEATWKAFLPK